MRASSSQKREKKKKEGTKNFSCSNLIEFGILFLFCLYIYLLLVL